MRQTNCSTVWNRTDQFSGKPDLRISCFAVIKPLCSCRGSWSWFLGMVYYFALPFGITSSAVGVCDDLRCNCPVIAKIAGQDMRLFWFDTCLGGEAFLIRTWRYTWSWSGFSLNSRHACIHAGPQKGCTNLMYWSHPLSIYELINSSIQFFGHVQQLDAS